MKGSQAWGEKKGEEQTGCKRKRAKEIVLKLSRKNCKDKTTFIRDL
jgi:hypothetical protein